MRAQETTKTTHSMVTTTITTIKIEKKKSNVPNCDWYRRCSINTHAQCGNTKTFEIPSKYIDALQ